MGTVDHFIIKFLFPSDKDIANKYMHSMKTNLLYVCLFFLEGKGLKPLKGKVSLKETPTSQLNFSFPSDDHVAYKYMNGWHNRLNPPFLGECKKHLVSHLNGHFALLGTVTELNKTIANSVHSNSPVALTP